MIETKSNFHPNCFWGNSALGMCILKAVHTLKNGFVYVVLKFCGNCEQWVALWTSTTVCNPFYEVTHLYPKIR